MVIHNGRQFSNNHIHRWNVLEEIANSITGGIGFLLGIAALVILIVDADLHGSAINIVSGTIFGVTILLSYGVSTIYHAILKPRVKQVLKFCDHACIFLLIAGTYTPFTLVTLHGAFGWVMFGLIWGIAIVGIVFKFYFFDRYERIGSLFYIAMGWMVIFAIVPLIHAMPWDGLIWLFIGGIAYTGGVTFFVLERIPFFHTIWHIFVLIGTASQFICIAYYVMPVMIK